ncbi:hypothetical protein CYMTET_19901, partial [Cymbomonas tetramitiformis]
MLGPRCKLARHTLTTTEAKELLYADRLGRTATCSPDAHDEDSLRQNLRQMSDVPELAELQDFDVDTEEWRVVTQRTFGHTFGEVAVHADGVCRTTMRVFPHGVAGVLVLKKMDYLSICSGATIEKHRGRLHLLREMEVTAQLSSELRLQMNNCLRPVWHPPGTLLCKEDHPIKAILLIENGISEVTTIRTNHLGQAMRCRVATLGPQSFVGDKEALHHETHSSAPLKAAATVQATTILRGFEIALHDFAALPKSVCGSPTASATWEQGVSKAALCNHACSLLDRDEIMIGIVDDPPAVIIALAKLSSPGRQRLLAVPAPSAVVGAAMALIQRPGAVLEKLRARHELKAPLYHHWEDTAFAIADTHPFYDVTRPDPPAYAMHKMESAPTVQCQGTGGTVSEESAGFPPFWKLPMASPEERKRSRRTFHLLARKNTIQLESSPATSLPEALTPSGGSPPLAGQSRSTSNPYPSSSSPPQGLRRSPSSTSLRGGAIDMALSTPRSTTCSPPVEGQGGAAAHSSPSKALRKDSPVKRASQKMSRKFEHATSPPFGTAAEPLTQADLKERARRRDMERLMEAVIGPPVTSGEVCEGLGPELAGYAPHGRKSLMPMPSKCALGAALHASASAPLLGSAEPLLEGQASAETLPRAAVPRRSKGMATSEGPVRIQMTEGMVSSLVYNASPATAPVSLAAAPAAQRLLQASCTRLEAEAPANSLPPAEAGQPILEEPSSESLEQLRLERYQRCESSADTSCLERPMGVWGNMGAGALGTSAYSGARPP